MTKTTITRGIALGALLAGGAALAAVSQQAVRGRLRPTDESSEAAGRFRIDLKDRGTTRQWEKLHVWGMGLDATADDDGNRPVYDVWLVDADANAADFGDVRMRRNGTFQLKAKYPRVDLPDGVDSLDDFGGGTIEVRDADGNAVLDGDIPEFLDVTDTNEPGTHAAARARDRSRLRATDDESPAFGGILAKYVNRPHALREMFFVKLMRLDPDAGPYVVVAIDGSDEIELGEIETSGNRGVGKLRVDTKDDDEIPGGGLLDLSQLDVEVRDAEGNVALEGSFPRIE